jgi:hypothetical protein
MKAINTLSYHLVVSFRISSSSQEQQVAPRSTETAAKAKDVEKPLKHVFCPKMSGVRSSYSIDLRVEMVRSQESRLYL